MPPKPINSPRLHPKKVDGFVRRDDALIDDDEEAWKSQEEHDKETGGLAFDAPRRLTAKHITHQLVMDPELRFYADCYGMTGH
ncbi:uncharacterized protein BO95DRAFT_439776 [Aspergillus brunneoviolaceus CBS 621.78]|uniref:Uncharacterized protein n=1 Tax=Aspergillus brunneoviolaceus CBS 621.78 TaxID=1450534 RepID=A0ACD1GIG9_9EURO|nr:hypothetical protein BO95DRAFT_439776 [Aspergillus brunneoviolaceus CBS 621.78]RAH49063.1 hypothetical protein BO95DRAFT_439776 [Aspergillus brunneoviolaceus CBS 621.78]